MLRLAGFVHVRRTARPSTNTSHAIVFQKRKTPSSTTTTTTTTWRTQTTTKMLSRLSPLKGSSAFTMNLVTYNVLSSSLASPSYFVECDPKHLDSENRYEKLLELLKEEMDRREAVICLQEVSQLWSGRLHAFFLKHNYYFVSSHYTKAWQGKPASEK